MGILVPFDSEEGAKAHSRGDLVVVLCICLCVYLHVHVHLYMKVHMQLCAYIYGGQRTTSSVMSQQLSIFTYLIFNSFMYFSPFKPL